MASAHRPHGGCGIARPLTTRLVVFFSTQACDAKSVSRLLVAAVTMCFDANNWTALGEYVILLTKRRGQLKQVGDANRAKSPLRSAHLSPHHTPSLCSFLPLGGDGHGAKGL